MSEREAEILNAFTPQQMAFKLAVTEEILKSIHRNIEQGLYKDAKDIIGLIDMMLMSLR